MNQPDNNTIDVACTLTSSELGTQAERWRRLRSEAQLGWQMTPDGIRLELLATPAIESELRGLVAVESDCCPWAKWSVSQQRGRLVMEVRSVGDGVAALHGMFADAPDTS